MSWAHGIPGIEFIFSFAGCLFIVILSKWLGRVFLQRPEDFYDS